MSVLTTEIWQEACRNLLITFLKLPHQSTSVVFIEGELTACHFCSKAAVQVHYPKVNSRRKDYNVSSTSLDAELTSTDFYTLIWHNRLKNWKSRIENYLSTITCGYKLQTILIRIYTLKTYILLYSHHVIYFLEACVRQLYEWLL